MTIDPHDVSTDATGLENAGRGREVKFGQMLERLIEHSEYRRNRKKISTKLAISNAALSQYIRQQTWPSFGKLLAIADLFDVSLDYLVYGQPTCTRRSMITSATTCGLAVPSELTAIPPAICS